VLLAIDGTMRLTCGNVIGGVVVDGL